MLLYVSVSGVSDMLETLLFSRVSGVCSGSDFVNAVGLQ